ncbi:zinc transporter ZupT [Chitinispirillales bacterium ANBcel5]|uniref:zinc transporter ZupT n=1 Tax=Cellulosispirillum alkaliphilum TaxID=3039283 RepID=UPI002A525781|nr:zinc transporter ZupT [Chitinispirillales bacterium ANBcel5]
MDTQLVLLAFGLTLLAGLSTVLGSVFAFFTKTTNTKFLSGAMGFSAGVMLYISFVELLPEGVEFLSEHVGEGTGNLYAIVAFFAGILVIAVIDKLIPSFENPHEMHKVEEINQVDKKNGLHRVGVFTALAIAIHNFPEGLVTFTATLADPALGISIAIAIAIHNIPEGIAVAVPIYYATGSRKKAFLYSFLAGIAEPIGALIGFTFFLHFFNDLILGILFASVAGIMVFISLDELLPAAEKYGEHHISIYGLILGMAVMAASLLMLG